MTTEAKNWFDVSRKGLAKLIERRGKNALIYELIGNAWDADGVTHVEVILEPEDGKPLVTIVVRDDAPGGFADLTHAWMLFAESNRKGHAGKRGRFCLGEKLVLALCEEASIISTKGGVMFDGRGRTNTRARRDKGTEFQGIARITRAELAEIRVELKKLIPPPGVTTTINGESLPRRAPLRRVETTLPTEIADEDGNLKRTARKCLVDLYEPLPGELAMLYELGVPVVETGDRFHCDVQQKIVLNMDRDNVTPAYLRAIRVLVVNALHDKLTAEDASATFVNEALADAGASPAAVTKALDLKYGTKRAVYDPSDVEANMNLVSQGYTLIHGSQLTKPQWDNVRKHEAAKPSGQIAPTKKALFSPDGKDSWVPKEKWTPAMHRVVEYTIAVARELTGTEVHVGILSDITQSWSACYGDQGFVYNLGRLGHEFFNRGMENDKVNRLIIHELGHHFAPNHLDEAYHEALCSLGAKLVRLALDPIKRKIFER